MFEGLIVTLLERLFGAIKRRRLFTVENDGFLDQRRMSYSELLRRLVGLDHASMPGTTPLNEGTVEQWTPVFRKDPESWRLIVYRKKVIVGYFSAFSLTDECFEGILSGRVTDSEINPEAIRIIDQPGRHKVYVCSIISLEDHDTDQIKVRNLVVDAFAKHVLGLAKRGVEIEKVCALATNEDGERICRKFGLIQVRGYSERQGGTVYAADIIPLDPRLRDKVWMKRLSKIYERQRHLPAS